MADEGIEEHAHGERVLELRSRLGRLPAGQAASAAALSEIAPSLRDVEVVQLVNSINSSVDALDGLFNELLDITKIDAQADGLLNVLIAGTEENGIYVSFNNGDTWESLKQNLPVTPVHDIAVTERDVNLVAYTAVRQPATRASAISPAAPPRPMPWARSPRRAERDTRTRAGLEKAGHRGMAGRLESGSVLSTRRRSWRSWAAGSACCS